MFRKCLTFSLALLAIFVSGCGSARRGLPVGPPVKTSDPHVAAGQKLFAHYCYACHPGGAGGLGPALNNKPLPAFAIRLQVRHGFGAIDHRETCVFRGLQFGDCLPAVFCCLRPGRIFESL